MLRSIVARLTIEEIIRDRAAFASAVAEEAEAEVVDARSDAVATFGEAAIPEMLVNVLPEVVGAAAAPLAGVDR